MKFVSRYKDLKKVIVPSNYIFNSLGQRAYKAGKMAEFHDFQFETKDEESIEILKNDPRYGIDYWSAEKDDVSPVSEEGQKLLEEEEMVKETVVTNCPTCGFRAASFAGLKAHIRARHG